MNPTVQAALVRLGGTVLVAIAGFTARLFSTRRSSRLTVELRRLDLEQRRREDRLLRLRQDLKELMYALFEVERQLNLFLGGHLQVVGVPKSPEVLGSHVRQPGEPWSPEVLESMERLRERREAARAGLLLDPDGQRLYEVFEGSWSRWTMPRQLPAFS